MNYYYDIIFSFFFSLQFLLVGAEPRMKKNDSEYIYTIMYIYTITPNEQNNSDREWLMLILLI